MRDEGEPSARAGFCHGSPRLGMRTRRARVRAHLPPDAGERGLHVLVLHVLAEGQVHHLLADALLLPDLVDHLIQRRLEFLLCTQVGCHGAARRGA